MEDALGEDRKREGNIHLLSPVQRKFKEDLEKRIRELEDDLGQIGRGKEREEGDISELKRKHTSEIDRLKGEISALHDKHLSDLEDEKEQYAKVTNAPNAISPCLVHR